MPTYCFPAVTGVPGSEATYLDWWSLSSPPALHYPEDPNWLGAFSIAHGDGAGTHIRFRALNGVNAGTKMLYLSWIAPVTNGLQLDIDGVNLLIGAATNAFVLRLRLAVTSATFCGDQTKYDAQTYSYNGTALSAHSATPAWVTDTCRVWINYNSSDTGLPVPWAFQIAVPLDTNLAPAGFPAVSIPSTADFKIWYQAQASMGVGNASVYPWVGTTAYASQDNVLPLPSQLTLADGRVPGPGATCATGVSLSWSGVKIWNPDGSARSDPYAIQLDLGKPYPPKSPPYDTNLTPDVSLPQHQNMFVAQPDVSSLSPTQIATLRARFRLANWGSQFSTPTPNSWKAIPGGEDVSYNSPAGQPVGHRVTWPKPPLDGFTQTLINGVKTWLNTNGTSGQNPHQCMLVELTGGSDIIFTKSSVFINTHVVSASTFERMAEISVVGMKPINPLGRDVYLYLETFNMPKQVVEDTSYNRRGPRATRSLGMQEGEGQQFFEVDDLLASIPVYRVHAYADTGDTLKLKDGSRVKILRPQTSFGYLAIHEGPLVGWETRLSGARRIATNFYVVEVPNSRAVNILTQIQARESANEAPLPPETEKLPGQEPGPRDPGCLLALLKLFGRMIRGS
jgi:hypothetical protein